MNSQAEKLRDKKYYHLAHRGSADLSHPAMKILLKIFKGSEIILDMGCGEGTRLATLLKNSNGKKKILGIDASEIAIKLAGRNYPEIDFMVHNLENLPFKAGEFDLLYSAYVFEHLTAPENVVKEAYRVLKPEGRLVIIAPNFGSPNRRSPNSTENKLLKLCEGFINDFKKQSRSKLEWTFVAPREDEYTIDADTTVEPYLRSLIKYCQSLGFNVEYYSSNWKVDKFSVFQFPFRVLGLAGIYPFTYWGPHLAIVLRK